MDTTAVVAAITDGGTAVAAIGAASLILVVGIKVWQRIRGAAVDSWGRFGGPFSFIRGVVMNGRFNRLVCAVCIMLCGIYSVSVKAATAGSAVFQAYSVLGKKRVGSNIRVDYAVKTNFEGSHIPRYKQVSVEYTPSDLAAMFASLKNKSPSSAIATVGLGAIVGGAGWAIDELTGQITRPVESGTDPDFQEGFYYGSEVEGTLAVAQTPGGLTGQVPQTVTDSD